MLHSMKFGLVPHWAKHEDNKLNTINARSEALVEGGGMWETMKRTKRCVVVAQGYVSCCSAFSMLINTTNLRYFEWLKKGNNKIPHFVKHQSGRLMLFAGLYDCANLEGLVLTNMFCSSIHMAFSRSGETSVVVLHRNNFREQRFWLVA
jgi:putative SOS response-associated peptidase YedK